MPSRFAPILLAGWLVASTGGCNRIQVGSEHVEEVRGVTIRYFHPPGMAHVSSQSTQDNDQHRTIMDATGGPTPDMHVEFSVTPEMHLMVNSRDYGPVRATDQVEIRYDREVRVNGTARAAADTTNAGGG